MLAEVAPSSNLNRVGDSGVPSLGVGSGVAVMVGVGGAVPDGATVGAARCVATTIVAISDGEVPGTCVLAQADVIATKPNASKPSTR